jgi:putative transposase
VIDTYSRYVPALDPRFSYRGEDVVRTLETVCTQIGYPKTIRVDQGSEFISRDLDLWAYRRGVTLDFSRPGKPTDTDVIEKVFMRSAHLFSGDFAIER